MIQNARQPYTLTLRGSACVLGERTWIMGVLNVTPDSFSDGGRFATTEAAVREGSEQFEAGADIVDVGGESTRPGAIPVDRRARRSDAWCPVIEALRRRGAGFVSVDTTKAEVARAALDAGADLVNDVSGFRFDPGMAPPGRGARRAGRADAPARRLPAAMHRSPRTRDVVREVALELGQRAAPRPSERASRVAARPRSRHRLREERGSQPGAAAPAARAGRAGPPAAGGPVAQELHRAGARPAGGRAAPRHRRRGGGLRPRRRPRRARPRRPRRWRRSPACATRSWIDVRTRRGPAHDRRPLRRVPAHDGVLAGWTRSTS